MGVGGGGDRPAQRRARRRRQPAAAAVAGSRADGHRRGGAYRARLHRHPRVLTLLPIAAPPRRRPLGDAHASKADSRSGHEVQLRLERGDQGGRAQYTPQLVVLATPATALHKPLFLELSGIPAWRGT
jgi:hypothetical protein